MSDQTTEDNIERQSTASQMLAQAREAMGLSQKEVADQLFLTTTFIRYIDDAEFDRIPKPAFIKGYLRSYAKAVRLDGDTVVQRFESEQQAAEQSVEIKGVTEETVGSANFTGPVLQTGVFGLIGVVALVTLVWYLTSESDDSPGQSAVVEESYHDESAGERDTSDTELQDTVSLKQVAADSRAADEADLEEKALMAIEAVGSAAAEDPAPTATDAVTETEIESATEEPVTDTDSGVTGDPEPEEANPRADVQFTRSDEDGQVVINLVSEGDDTMELTFVDDCWLEIEDGHGMAIYGDLNRAGDVLKVKGTAPFELLLGKATAVSLHYQGQAIDLARYTTSDNTARIKVGDGDET